MKKCVLASECLPPDFADALCFICDFPAPPKTQPVEALPEPASPVARPGFRRNVMRFATELWETFQTHDGRHLPVWVRGEIEESVRRENPLAPLEAAKPQRLSLTYGTRGSRWQRYWQDTKGRAR